MADLSKLSKLADWLRKTGSASKTYENLPDLMQEVAKKEALGKSLPVPKRPEILEKPIPYPSGSGSKDQYRELVQERLKKLGIINEPNISSVPEEVIERSMGSKLRGLQDNINNEAIKKEASAFSGDKTKAAAIAAALGAGAMASPEAKAAELEQKRRLEEDLPIESPMLDPLDLVPTPPISKFSKLKFLLGK